MWNTNTLLQYHTFYTGNQHFKNTLSNSVLSLTVYTLDTRDTTSRHPGNEIYSLKDLTVYYQDLTLYYQDLTVYYQDLTVYYQDLTVYYQDLTLYYQDLTLYYRDLTLYNQDLTLYYQDIDLFFLRQRQCFFFMNVQCYILWIVDIRSIILMFVISCIIDEFTADFITNSYIMHALIILQTFKLKTHY